MQRPIILMLHFIIFTFLAISQTNVRIETEVGDIVVELYPDKAPVTVANFLRYVDGSFYNGGSFYRTVREDNEVRNNVPIEIIQAGVHPWKENFPFPPIILERTSLASIHGRRTFHSRRLSWNEPASQENII
ncbi:MAG: peptidylprolyl isomerase [Bacteroidetes bacterium]|nr:peptidylprolyl isomerase [Bacteroidota bacterium]